MVDGLITDREDSLELITRLVRRIVHDLSNPLAAVVGFAELLARPGLPPEKMTRYITMILEQSSRARGMIDTMAQFGDLPEMSRDQFDLVKVLRHSVTLRTLGQKSLTVDTSIECPEELQVEADRNMCTRIFQNLLQNAEQAFKESGVKDRRRILVTAEAAAGSVVVCFRDSGPGVPEDDRERIFEPFYSGRMSGGLGLGLFVSRRLAEKMGGSHELESPQQDQTGACFKVELPRPEAPRE